MMMKKVVKFLVCFISLFSMAISAFAEVRDYAINVEDKFVGTYVPVDVEECLKTAADYCNALRLGYPKHHDVLFMGKNICYSDVHFHDGYAITAQEFKDYKFEVADGETYVTDDKNCKYRRISNFVNEKGYGYKEYEEFIVDTIFKNVKDRKNIVFAGTAVSINKKDYAFEYDINWNDNTNVLFWFNGYAVKRNGLNAVIYGSENVHHETSATDEVIDTIPLFFVDPENFTETELKDVPKDQLRLVRNYVYAFHGYKFKSEDLQKFFGNFTWYKINPYFSEEDFSTAEKAFIKKIQNLEK